MTAQRSMRGILAATASVFAISMASSAAFALPGRDDIGPGGMVDTTNVWGGVGMMYSNGFVCTGQLINPRTVIFAAHCVSDWDENMGSNFGGTPMAFSFGVDALPGFQNWFANAFASNPDMLVYNVLQVQTVTNGGLAFPGADIAMATLDSPAIGVPTYGMLFSPLTESTHASLVGYGTNGTGTDGPIGGIDWKRRAGENMVDGLFSQDDFITSVFQVAPGEWTGFSGISGAQALYHIDFDRPDRTADDCRRGTVYIGPNDLTCDTPPYTGPITWDFTSVFDGGDHINWFGGDALDREAGTAGGDSGSGLFVEIDGQQLVTGVLSGGWSFTSPNGGYGDLSYYNPLFLYQNWITGANPYVYASALAGDGVWSDPTHWQQDLDPGYMVVDGNGNLVNGLNPDAPADLFTALTTTDSSWGTVFDTEVNAYRDGGVPQEPLAGGQFGAAANSAIGSASITGADGLGSTNRPAEVTIPGVEANAGLLDPVQDVLAGAPGDAAAPGGGEFSPVPGGWVPNNDFGSFGTFAGPASFEIARFYDVELWNAGTTTVDMDVELDGFTISNTGAELIVAEPYTFNVLIAFNHFGGLVDIAGRVNAREYMLTGGLLSGTGELNTMTLWNIAGAVTPGTLGGIGEFSLLGDYVQASAGGLLIDFDDADNDLLSITGDASLSGLLLVNPVAGYMPHYGDNFTFLTANSVVGQFDAVADLPGVLKPVAFYTANSAGVRIEASNFHTQATFTNNFQVGLADALDQGRAGSYDDLAGIYGWLDLLEDGALTTGLDTLSPYESVMFDRSIRSHSDVLGRALREQIGTLGMLGGGDDVLAEAKQANGMAGMSDLGLLARATVKSNYSAGGTDAGDTRRIFGAIGTIDATARTFAGSPDTAIEGDYSLIGLDVPVTDAIRIGVAAGFASSDNTAGAALGGTNVSTESEQVVAFGSYSTGRMSASLAIGYASHDSDATRMITLGGVMIPSQTRATADEVTVDAAIRYDLYSSADGIRITPMASLTASDVDFNETTSFASTGGLHIDARSGSNLVARIGSAFGLDLGTNIAANLYLGAAQQYGDGAETYSASFLDAPGVSFSAPSGVELNTNWWEVAGSVSADLSFGGTLTLSHERQINRDFAENEITSLSYSLPF